MAPEQLAPPTRVWAHQTSETYSDAYGFEAATQCMANTVHLLERLADTTKLLTQLLMRYDSQSGTPDGYGWGRRDIISVLEQTLEPVSRSADYLPKLRAALADTLAVARDAYSTAPVADVPDQPIDLRGEYLSLYHLNRSGHTRMFVGDA